MTPSQTSMPWILTKTCSAVEGTRTSAHTPEGASAFSGDVLNELALRRLLRKRSKSPHTIQSDTKLIISSNQSTAGTVTAGGGSDRPSVNGARRQGNSKKKRNSVQEPLPLQADGEIK